MIKTPESLQKLVVKALKILGFSAGSILFVGSDGSISQDNTNLFWDNVNKRLGLGVSPTEKLDVNGNVVIRGNYILMEGSKNTGRGLEWFYSASDRYGIAQDGGGTVRIYGSSLFPATSFRFCLANSLTSFTDLVIITRDGKVGIGAMIPTAKLDVAGAIGYDQLRLRTPYTPTSSADPNGNVGDIAWDDNYIYVKTNAGWKRAPLSAF